MSEERAPANRAERRRLERAIRKAEKKLGPRPVGAALPPAGQEPPEHVKLAFVKAQVAKRELDRVAGLREIADKARVAAAEARFENEEDDEAQTLHVDASSSYFELCAQFAAASLDFLDAMKELREAEDVPAPVIALPSNGEVAALG